MNELLFSSKEERCALENVLAFNQIKKCDAGIEKYKNEIADLEGKICSILKSENIDDNYIEAMKKYKGELKGLEQNDSRKNVLSAEIKENEEKIEEFNKKIKEMEEELESLKRLVFDSNNAKEIVEAQNSIEVTTKKLEDLYTLVENLNNDNTTATIEIEFIKQANREGSVDAEDIHRVEISNALHQTTLKLEEVIKDLDLAVREDIEFCLKKIANREKEIAKFEEHKSEIIKAYPGVVELDYAKEIAKLNDLFAELNVSVDDIEIEEDSEDLEQESEEPEEVVEEDNTEETDDVDIETDMVKVESIEKPDLEFREVEEATKVKEKQEDKEEEIVVDNSNSFSTIGSVPYIFSEGESLESIAEKVYPSKDCWEAIYNYNKEEIDNYLTANGMSNDAETIKTLASDKYLFAGIQLNIPTDANYRG